MSVDEAMAVLEAAGVVPAGRDVRLSESAKTAIERFLWRRTVAIATVALGVGSLLGSALQASFISRCIHDMADAASAARIAQQTADEANAKALAAKAESERMLREIGAAAGTDDKLRVAVAAAMRDGALRELLLKDVVLYGHHLEVVSVSQLKGGEQQRLALDADRPDSMAAYTGKPSEMTKMVLRPYK